MPRGTGTDTPSLAEDALIARDGTRLPLRHWGPSAPRAVIVALHGMGDYSNFIARPAAYWATQGIATFAFDQRGFGASEHFGLWAGSDVMRDDFEDAVAAARARYPHVPLFALGESMGGAVVLSDYATASAPPVDGIVLVAPAVWSRADMPFLYRTVLWLTAHIVPDMTTSGRGVVHIWPSDNIPMLRAYAKDPLVQKVTRADAVWGLVNLMDQARAAPAHLGPVPPILMVYGARDQVIPAAPTQAVAAALGPKAEVHRYAHGYHMLLRDLDGPIVWQDIETWIEKGGTR